MSAPADKSRGIRLALPENARTMLARLARKDLRVRLMRFPLLAAIVLPLFWLFEALVDLVFNLSWTARASFLAASALLAGWLFFRHGIVPFRRRLNIRSAALLVERKFPRFRSALISAVDFTSAADGLAPRSAPLVRILLGQVQRLVDRTEVLKEIVDTRPLRRLFLAALAVLAAIGALAWHFQPQSLVLARRVFLSRDAMPSRTTVVPVTEGFTINAGTDAELAARAQGVVPRNGRVVIVYADGHRQTLPVSASSVEPGVFRVTLRNVLQSFHYRFEINDGVGAEFPVKTRTLPSLARTKFLYVPPAYTGRPETELPPGSLSLLAGSRVVIEGEATQPLQSAALELKGLDQTLRMENADPIHNISLRLESGKARESELAALVEKRHPDVDASAADREAAKKAEAEANQARQGLPPGEEKRRLDFKWEQAALALREAQAAADRARSRFEQARREYEAAQRQNADLKKQLDQAAPAPDQETAARRKRVVRAEIPIPKEGLNGLSIHLVDEDGVASENDPVYRVNLTADKPPVAEILEPKAERTTAEAGDKVPVKFRARDDYRLEKVALRYVVLRPNADGDAVPAEEGEIPVTLAPGSTSVLQDHVWDLGAFVPPLVEGCSVSFWLEARDHFTLHSNTPAVSRKMILAVVSAEEKRKELIAEMEKAAREIERLSERQRKVNEKNDANIRR